MATLLLGKADKPGDTVAELMEATRLTGYSVVTVVVDVAVLHLQRFSQVIRINNEIKTPYHTVHIVDKDCQAPLYYTEEQVELEAWALMLLCLIEERL